MILPLEKYIFNKFLLREVLEMKKCRQQLARNTSLMFGNTIVLLNWVVHLKGR